MIARDRQSWKAQLARNGSNLRLSPDEASLVLRERAWSAAVTLAGTGRRRLYTFLTDLPDEALCAQDSMTGAFARRDNDGYTRFRIKPSKSSRSDIHCCINAMFRAWRERAISRSTRWDYTVPEQYGRSTPTAPSRSICTIWCSHAWTRPRS